MTLKLPFALKDDKIVTIKEVERGKKCNCKCPSCGVSLIAKQGAKTVHHFAHFNGSQCKYAVETALHLMAKEILFEEKKIMLPPVRVRVSRHAAELEIFKKQIVEFDKVTLENKIDNIVPDIIIKKEGETLLVEIAVTHFIDDQKKKKIEEMNYSTLEIDLSNFKGQFDKSMLRKILIEEDKQKKWIHNTKKKEFDKKIKEYIIPLETTYRDFAKHVDYCPIKARIWRGKPYANFIDDCVNCNYYFDRQGEDYIHCTGKYKEEIDQLIKKYRTQESKKYHTEERTEEIKKYAYETFLKR